MKLAFCGKCIQMTNHIGNECQKCKKTPDEWAETRDRAILIADIIKRADNLKLTPSKLNLAMDLECAHKSCPLDFKKLLAFDNFNFAHDIVGIQNHMDRENARLSHRFLPRCAK